MTSVALAPALEALMPDEPSAALLLREGLHQLTPPSGHRGSEAAALDKHQIDCLIAAADARIASLLDTVLHHPQFQALESAWRSVGFLWERADLSENIRIALLDASPGELSEDFADAGDVESSSLYRMVYSEEYGTFGGEPFGAMCSLHGFTASAPDMKRLRQCGAVAAAAHAPFIANADARFFGSESLGGLPAGLDYAGLFEGAEYAAWRDFRETEEARYVALCAPRFLLREAHSPHGARRQSVPYWESHTGPTERLWGPASVALTACVAASFSAYRWCPHIVGPQAGGAVEGLPMPSVFDGATVEAASPVELRLSDRQELALANAGLAALTARKGSARACFFAAPSAHRPAVFADTPEGNAASTNARLGAQLPYMFIVSRLAHYLKVLQREEIGRWKDRSDVERELNAWLRQYVADMENPTPSVRARRPLRAAHVAVEEIPGEAGWYRCHLSVQPHLKYMGTAFSLSLVGRLERGS